MKRQRPQPRVSCSRADFEALVGVEPGFSRLGTLRNLLLNFCSTPGAPSVRVLEQRVPCMSWAEIKEVRRAVLRVIGFRQRPGRRSPRPDHPLAAWLDGRRQVAVAKDLGISKDHLSRLSSGRSRPSLALAQKITDYTGGRVPVSAWRGA